MRIALLVLLTTFTFHAPTGLDIRGIGKVYGIKNNIVREIKWADVVEMRTWSANFTPLNPAYGQWKVIKTDTKFWWAPWLTYLDGKKYIVTPVCARGDSCGIKIKTKRRNGYWSDWTYRYWREP